MMLLSCATMLPPFVLSCTDEEGKMFEASGIPPFKVWQEMIMALETGPDHIEGRMKQLIAEKNPEAMFHFVRDEFYVIPPSDNSLYDLGSKMKWELKGDSFRFYAGFGRVDTFLGIVGAGGLIKC